MRTRSITALAVIFVSLIFALGCASGGLLVGRVTPTPTRTPKPTFTFTPTHTPQPPPTATTSATLSAGPLPTDTPEVPPTNTPQPPTATPEVPPTDTPEPPTATPAPTDTPPPAPPTDTPTPVPPTDTPTPNFNFVVKEIRVLTPEENGGKEGRTTPHNVYFSVIDANGQGLNDLLIKELTTGKTYPEYQTLLSGSKRGDRPGGAEFLIEAQDYYFQIVGDTSGKTYVSQKTHRISIINPEIQDLIPNICPDVPSCQEGVNNHWWHWSYYVTFQRTW